MRRAAKITHMPPSSEVYNRVFAAIQPQRLIDMAVRLIEVPSPTRNGAAVADRFAQLLGDSGLEVQRVPAGWATAPAVVARYQTGRPGRTLQFNGHLDTVHLPFVPPRVEDGQLYGSGASDMKGGVAAMCEAAWALRDSGCLPAGGILITGHDLHESPWGDGSQVDGLIDGGYLGDAVLLPEYVSDRLPVIGRGLAILEIRITRVGEPVHEVLGGLDQPSVIRAGARLIARLEQWDHQLSARQHPLGGRESCFVGQIHAGEIYNQAPIELEMSGTRRWLPGTSPGDVKRVYEQICSAVAEETGTQVDGKFTFVRDACELDASASIVSCFQAAHEEVTGCPLPEGPKPFVDDGNTFMSRGGIPAISHGPRALGAHTLNEQVAVDELVRVAKVYAATAIEFCGAA